MGTTVRRWLGVWLLLVPVLTLAVVLGLAVWQGWRASPLVFGLSFVGAAAVVTGFSGAIQATEKLEAAGQTGILNMSSDLLTSDAEMAYGDRAALSVWGLGLFVLCWVWLITA